MNDKSVAIAVFIETFNLKGICVTNPRIEPVNSSNRNSVTFLDGMKKIKN